MLKETLPENFELRPVFLIDHEGNQRSAQAAVREWNGKEAFWRGFKRAIKIVGILILLPLPFAFMEPFLFLVWGSLLFAALLLIMGPWLHLRYWNERQSFFYVEGTCPNCRKDGRLEPYLDSAFSAKFTAICPDCGQTTQVLANE